MVFGKLRTGFSILTSFGKLTVISLFLSFSLFVIYHSIPFIVPPVYGDSICTRLENKYSSPDCAISYQSFDEIPLYGHYITIRGIVPTLQGGLTEFLKLYYSVYPEAPEELLMMDGDGNAISVSFTHSAFKDANLKTGDLIGSIVDVTCHFVPIFIQDPLWLRCDNVKINNVVPVDDIENYTRYIVPFETSNVVAESLISARIDNWSIYEINYRTRYNGTHWLDYWFKKSDLVDIWEVKSKYRRADLGFTSHDAVDEAWDYYGNFSFWTYVINVSVWNHPAPFAQTFFSKNRELSFENAESEPIILSGHGFQNISYAGVVYTGTMWSELDGTLSMYNLVGDGICGKLENPLNSNDCSI